MDLVDAPNSTAVTAIQNGLATGANQTTILNRLGTWTGTGVNTILGAFKALLSKVASAPSDIGGTFDPATDSTEAIRDTAPLGTAMRGTDGAALAATALSNANWTDARAGKLDNLDATVSSRSTYAGGAVASVTAGVELAASQPSYAPSKAGDAMALTSGERTSTADAILARALASESYAADGATPTLSQILWMIWAGLVDFDISGTTLTVRRQNGTAAMTFTLDDATNPTARTRAT
jgi:hypothetical protein